jgi:hypothetical protein
LFEHDFKKISSKNLHYQKNSSTFASQNKIIKRITCIKQRKKLKHQTGLAIYAMIPVAGHVMLMNKLK